MNDSNYKSINQLLFEDFMAMRQFANSDDHVCQVFSFTWDTQPSVESFSNTNISESFFNLKQFLYFIQLVFALIRL